MYPQLFRPRRKVSGEFFSNLDTLVRSAWIFFLIAVVHSLLAQVATSTFDSSHKTYIFGKPLSRAFK